MNKTELIKLAAAKSGISKEETSRVLSAIIETISETLARDEQVQFPGIGTFSTTELHAARTDFNPWNQAVIDIPAQKEIHFKALKRR